MVFLIRRCHSLNLFLAFLCIWSFVSAGTAHGDVRWTTSIVEAFRASRCLARPVVVLGVSPQCAPCQRLKSAMRQEVEYQDLLGNVVVLELQAESPQFANFLERHPQGFRGTVPMVYVMTPSEDLHFVRAGAPTLDELRVQIRSTPLETTLSDRITAAEQATSRAELVQALQWMLECQQLGSELDLNKRFRQVQTGVIDRMDQYLTKLETDLENGTDVYRAAFRMTELYLQLAGYPELQEKSRKALICYRDRENTQIPIRQSMHVVRGRLAEHRQEYERAADWYHKARHLQAESPLGKFANLRLAALPKPKATGIARAAP